MNTSHSTSTYKAPHPLRSVFVLAGFLLVCFAVAAIGALATVPAIPTWYAGIQKPSFNPPNWIFGPVWSVLYATMAVAAWLVWRATSVATPQRRNALAAFFVQLALNGAWTPIFFHFHQLGWSLAVIAALWLAILVTLLLFWKIRRLAGILLIPYIVWVSFATALNAAIWHLN
ncbi:tryptophan-rich sensory protein [soil metagenome]